MQHLDEELQAGVIDEDIDDGHKEIPNNLCPTFQRRAGKTDVARHPKACQESDGELENEGSNVRREGDETKVEDLFAKDKIIENIVQHPLQNQIQAAASRITEQLKAHHLAERRIEKVDDLGQGAFNPKFYVFQG